MSTTATAIAAAVALPCAYLLAKVVRAMLKDFQRGKEIERLRKELDNALANHNLGAAVMLRGRLHELLRKHYGIEWWR